MSNYQATPMVMHYLPSRSSDVGAVKRHHHCGDVDGVGRAVLLGVTPDDRIYLNSWEAGILHSGETHQD